jgi:hypothetical protein
MQWNLRNGETSRTDMEVLNGEMTHNISLSQRGAGIGPTTSKDESMALAGGKTTQTKGIRANKRKNKSSQNKLNKIVRDNANNARRVAVVNKQNNIPEPKLNLDDDGFIDFWEDDYEEYSWSPKSTIFLQFCGNVHTLIAYRGIEHACINEHLHNIAMLQPEHYYLKCKGKVIDASFPLMHNDWVEVFIRLRGGSQKPKRKITLLGKASASSSEDTIDTGSAKALKRLLRVDPEKRTLRENELVGEISAAFPVQSGQIQQEVRQEEILNTQKECDYNVREKQKVTEFHRKQIMQFNQATNVASDPVISLSKPVLPEPKVNCAPLSANVKQIHQVQSMRMVEFDYFVPDKGYLIFGIKKWKVGSLPQFATIFLNQNAALTSTAVNVNNIRILLFREEFCREYIKSKQPFEVAHFKHMITAYILMLQHDVETEQVYRSFKTLNVSRKKNSQNIKDDSDFGVTFKNLFEIGKEYVDNKLVEAARVVSNAVMHSRIPDFIEMVEVKATSLIDRIRKNHPVVLTCDDEVYNASDYYWSEETSDIVFDEDEISFAENSITQDEYSEVSWVYEEPKGKEEKHVDVDEPLVEIVEVEKLPCMVDEDFEVKPLNEEEQELTLLDVDYFETIQPRIGETRPTNKKLRKQLKRNETRALRKDKKCTVEAVKDNAMTIIVAFPTFSVYIEELVKCIPGGWKIIGRLDDWIHDSNHRYQWHRRSMRLGFFDRIDMHFEHNAGTSELIEEYETHSLCGIPLPDIIEPEANCLPLGTTIKTLPLPNLTYEQAKDYDGNHIGNTIVHLETKKQSVKFFPLLFAATKLVSFDNTYDNFKAAVYQRLLVPKTHGPKKGLWASLPKLPIIDFNFKPDQETWISTLIPLQKIKMIEWKKNLEEGIQADSRTKVFLKMQELLNKGYGRLIFNVSPKYLYLLGDFISQLSKTLSNGAFGSIPKYAMGFSNSFYYASSFDDVKMNQYFNLAMKSTTGTYSLVLGDDTATIDRIRGKFIETDYSNYDSTQVKGGGLDVFPEYLRSLNCVEQADVYEQMYDEKIDWKHGPSQVSLPMPEEFEKPPWRMSGEPGTSLANSLTNIVATNAVLAGFATYDDLGLVVKKKEFDSPKITFLKGIWLYAHDAAEYKWVRLPSFLLKLKVFTDPVTVYPKSFSTRKAYQQMLYSQWLGFGNMLNNWFYKKIDVFLKRMCPLALAVEHKEEYKVFSRSKFQVEDVVFDSFMLDRYGITEIESNDFLEFLDREVLSVPAIIRHSLLDKLMAVDC